MSLDQLVSAREALGRGDAAAARRLVARVLLADPGNEQAWLLMARLANNRDQTIECLEHALRINPTNLATLSALRSMSHRRPVPSATAAPITVVPLDQEMNPVPTISATPIEIEAPKLISLPLTEAIEESIQRPRQKLNKALVFGSLIVLLVI